MGDALPTGTVTFLFTDVEDSTRLWEAEPDAMAAALKRHDEIIETLVERSGGVVVRPRGEGDSRFCAFSRATDGVAAALGVQRAFLGEPWTVPLRIRIALHTGEADLRAGDYYGAAVNRCARIRSIAHGGQTLVSLTTEELVRDALPDGGWLKDLGPHQLKDLTRLEHVFQLCHEDLGDEFPVLRSLETLPHNLPIQLTNFVGRDLEVRDVRKLLAESRLVTLTGAAGCGKTRLAVQVAADVLEEFADGIWFADLAPVADPTLVQQAIARAVGVQEEAGRPLMESILDSLRRKSILLILDNCEHVLGAAAQDAKDVLQACADVRILATGREALGVAGEVPWRVPSLSLPQADGPLLLEALTEFEAIRLFIYRARAAAPTLELTDEDAPAIAKICRRLDGIPLAIELAAARADVLACDQIAARLDDTFRLLTGGSRTALERQQTLRAAVDWSYALLSAAEKTLFARLSVFAGGFTLDAAEEVCSLEGEHDLLDLLTGLVRKSIVAAEHSGRAARYRLLETMRQYAREKLLESGEGNERRTVHLAWCRRIANEGDAELHGPKQVEWLERLGVEHDNMRAALEWAIGSGDAEAAMRLASDLSWFWNTRGHWSEARRWLADALALPGGSPAARGWALQSAGRFAWFQGDFDAADRFYEQAEPLGEKAGDRKLLAAILYGIGGIAQYRGDVPTCNGYMNRSMEIALETGDRWMQSAIWNARGLVSNEVAESRGFFERALSISKETGDIQAIGLFTAHVGAMAIQAGDFVEGRRLLMEALDHLRSIGDKRLVASTMNSLAMAAFFQVDYEAARDLLAEVASIAHDLGGVAGDAWVLESRALRSYMDDDYETAIAAQGEIIAIAERAGAHANHASSLFLRGHYLTVAGRVSDARRDLTESIELSKELHDVVASAAPASELGLIEMGEGNVARAHELLVGSLREIQAAGVAMPQIVGVERLAEVAVATGQGARAASLLGTAEAVREKLELPQWPARLPWYEATVAKVRAACSQEEFEKAWAEGRAMPLEEAVAYALEQPGPTTD